MKAKEDGPEGKWRHGDMATRQTKAHVKFARSDLLHVNACLDMLVISALSINMVATVKPIGMTFPVPFNSSWNSFKKCF